MCDAPEAHFLFFRYQHPEQAPRYVLPCLSAASQSDGAKLNKPFPLRQKIDKFRKRRVKREKVKIRNTRMGIPLFLCIGDKKYFLEFAYGLELTRPNHAIRRVYHPQLVAVYHQCIALYIIKPQGECTLTRDEIQGRLADLDDMHRTLCGDDIPSLRLG